MEQKELRRMAFTLQACIPSCPPACLMHPPPHPPDFVVLPLFTTFTNVFTSAKPFLEAAQANYQVGLWALEWSEGAAGSQVAFVAASWKQVN